MLCCESSKMFSDLNFKDATLSDQLPRLNFYTLGTPNFGILH